MKELIQQLEEIEKKKASLESEIARARELERDVLVDEILQMIDDRGFGLQDIWGLIAPAPQAKKRGNRGNGSYRGWVSDDDPSLTYVRGRTPEWILSKMTELGMNPKNKEDRRRFLETRCSPRD